MVCYRSNSFNHYQRFLFHFSEYSYLRNYNDVVEEEPCRHQRTPHNQPSGLTGESYVII